MPKTDSIKIDADVNGVREQMTRDDYYKSVDLFVRLIGYNMNEVSEVHIDPYGLTVTHRVDRDTVRTTRHTLNKRHESEQVRLARTADRLINTLHQVLAFDEEAGLGSD